MVSLIEIEADGFGAELAGVPMATTDDRVGLDRGAALRTLDEVRSQLIADGKNELVGKVADVIRYLRPSPPPVGDLMSTTEAVRML